METEKFYYHVKIKEHMEDENGKVKTYTREKLINAVNYTDMEKLVHTLYAGVTFDWSITDAKVSKIDEIID